MATINNFEDLEIWKLAREICKDIYKIINYPEFSKDFGLVRQINDSSGSIMDNIAEGFERKGIKNSASSFQYPKVHAENAALNLYGHSTGNTFQRKNSKQFIPNWQMKASKSKTL